MEILANLPYFKVTRIIDKNTQYQKEEEHEITLSLESVCTTYDSFLLDEVLDVSYRFFSKDIGFFYLHTKKGMYSFTIRTSPKSFIEQFKRIKSFHLGRD